MPYSEQKKQYYLAMLVVVILIISLIPASFRDDTPVIVITGDFEKRDDFSKDVFDGANNAALHRKDAANRQSPRIIKLNTKSNESLAEFRAKFLACYTQYNLLAVISADISTMAPTVLKVANSYKVPVLLTVATSDSVLNARHEDLSFRLVPTDTKQAEKLAWWCHQKKHPMIIHGGQTPYGRFLGNKLVELISQEEASFPLISSYFDSTEMFSILVPIRDLGLDGIVFIGYSDRFVEFFTKLEAIAWKGAVLLSDGCYSPDLIRKPPIGELFLSYPTDPVPRVERFRVQANGIFGWDAYVLLTETFDEIKRNKEAFGTALRATAINESSNDEDLFEVYRFGPAGENERAEFHIFYLQDLAKNFPKLK